MNSVFLLRLAFDLTAASLLLLGLAYWWLGNVVHELAGTAMFLLLIVHNVFNRRWYGAVPRTRREPRALFNVGVTFLLLIAMLALLVTSVLISNALSRLHAGLWRVHGAADPHPRRLLGAGHRRRSISACAGRCSWASRATCSASRNRARCGRSCCALVAAAIAIHGVWSSFALGHRQASWRCR